MVRGRVTNATTLTFDRDHAGQTMDLTWYLVEFTDSTTVQHNTAAFATTDAQKDISISSVNTAMSFAVGGAWLKKGRTSYASDDNPGVVWMAHELTSSTNLRITRALTGSAAADMGWFVVNPPVPGITVTPTSGLTVAETSGTATFTVVLDWQPSANVTIGLSSTDTTEGTVSPGSLTFTTANWGTPQTVIVTGVNDFLDDGDIGYTVVTAAATSTDSVYSSMNASDVSVTTTDDDVSGFTVSAISGNTTEAGGTATFTVALTAQPTANVSFGLSLRHAAGVT